MYKGILCFDIDGTQYAHDNSDWDSDSYALKRVLTQLREKREIFLVHNTGRPFPWICHGEQVPRYLAPIIADSDRLITHGGTVIWGKDGKQDQNWRAHVESIASIDCVQGLISNLSVQGLILDPETFGNEFKVCVRTTASNQMSDCKRIERVLEAEYPGRFEVSYWNSKSIDITPLGINKKTALEHVIQEENLGDVRVITAGDSMNDCPILSVEYFHKIAVGNAAQRLRSAVEGLPNIFFASASQPCALGVMAGLRHYGIIDSTFECEL